MIVRAACRTGRPTRQALVLGSVTPTGHLGEGEVPHLLYRLQARGRRGFDHAPDDWAKRVGSAAYWARQRVMVRRVTPTGAATSTSRPGRMRARAIVSGGRLVPAVTAGPR